MRKTEDFFIEQSIKLHGDKYIYEKVSYVRDDIKVIITCPIHSDFHQTPSAHLQGNGCPTCGKENTGYKRTDFIEKADGRICTFYTLRCFNESEKFYKIGITMRNIENRYPCTKSMPYEYEVISEVKGSAGFIWDLELAEKRKLKDFNYQPTLQFGGSKTECFTQYKI